ncbi:hypothetical protein PBAL39_00200 [Pedobacter sp. BAL39]|nr:hypothetical protein PBAL39_00200 [Pedobacter sp. BAL39]
MIQRNYIKAEQDVQNIATSEIDWMLNNTVRLLAIITIFSF